MTEDAQILIARLLAHQTIKREDRLVKRALSDELFRADVDARLKTCGMKLIDNVYADYVTIALQRDSESKVFGSKDTWQNNNFGLARDGVALLVVLWAMIILPKRERQEAHQLAEEDQNDMFGKEKPLPRAEQSSIGISYRALLADFGEKLGKKTRMDMNLGQLARLGFVERKGDLILEGPLLDLMMDTDALKDRIINGALSDIFHLPAVRTPAEIQAITSDEPTDATMADTTMADETLDTNLATDDSLASATTQLETPTSENT